MSSNNNDDDGESQQERQERKDQEEEKHDNWVKTVLLPHVALFAVPLLASFNMIFSKASFTFHAEDESPLKPFTLAVLRTTISAIIFNVMSFIKDRCAPLPPTGSSSSSSSSFSTTTIKVTRIGKQQPEEEPEKEQISILDYISLASLGIFGLAVNFLFFLSGIQLVDTTSAAALMATVPVIVYFLSHFVLGEELTKLKLIATVLVIGGNLLMIHVQRLFTNQFDDERRSPSYYLGVLYMILNQLCFSYYVVYSKPLFNKFDVITFMRVVSTFGAVTLLLFSLVPTENIVTDQLLARGKNKPLGKWSILAICYSSFVQSCIVYLLFSYAAAKTSPLTTSVVNNAQPLLICVFGIFLFHETITDSQVIIGGVMILLGVICIAANSILSAGSSSSSSSSSSSQKEESKEQEKEKEQEQETEMDQQQKKKEVEVAIGTE